MRRLVLTAMLVTAFFPFTARAQGRPDFSAVGHHAGSSVSFLTPEVERSIVRPFAA